MPGIAKQRQAVAQQAADEFGNHDSDNNDQGDGKPPDTIAGLVTVFRVPVTHASLPHLTSAR